MVGLPVQRLHSALLALLCACGAGVQASPTDSPDRMAQLLIDRGVLDKRIEPSGTAAIAIDSAAAIGRQVRDTTSNLVVSAMNFLGVPYKRGGNSSNDGFDCSGFTRHIYESALGLVLPRKVDEQAKAPGFTPVKRDDLQPGDLVFFNTLRRTFSHVGIYVGGGKFIHAPRTGGEVRVENMGVRYWAKRFTGARRADNAAQALAASPLPGTPAVAAEIAPALPSEPAPP